MGVKRKVMLVSLAAESQNLAADIRIYLRVVPCLQVRVL